MIDDDPSIEQGSGGIDELVQWLEGIEALNEHAREVAQGNIHLSA